MSETKEGQFVNDFRNFYQMYFDCIASSVDYLADIHNKYSDQYDKILQFSDNPESIEDMINNLPIEKQAILLRILYKAGEFGRKFAMLMEMSPKDKKKFAEDLKKFSGELDKM